MGDILRLKVGAIPSGNARRDELVEERAILETECEALKRELERDLRAIRHRIAAINRILGNNEDAGSALRGTV
jgi:hypothetical protein